jgi:hypothetical protein
VELTETSNKIKISPQVMTVVGFSFVVTAFSGNTAYLVFCLVAFYAIIFLLWRHSQPAVLVFAMLMQWVQVVTYVIWMNNSGWDINRLSSHADMAVALSCLGLIAMSATISLGLKNLKMPSSEQFFQEAKLINEKKILFLYLISTFFLGGLGYAMGGNPGFFQILMTFATLKWVFFIVFGYVAWINKKNRVLLIVIIILEFTTALYSYFSSFKDVIYFTIMLALSFITRVTFKQLAYGLVIVTSLLFLLLTWTAVKGDYRKFLNQGTKQQVIEVSREDAFFTLGEKVSALTWDKYQQVLDLFLYRAQYILHLAKTMDRVPAVIPHENGQIWKDNITFVLEPRLFFPDKPIYEATVKTNKYTGFKYSGLKQGSSFSLGYFADSYIDFGYVGMFLPLILIALFVVFIYRVLYGFSKINLLLRYAMINVALYDLTAFESDGLFLIGRLLLMFLVYWFISKFVLSRLQKWLYKASEPKSWQRR